MPGPITQAVDPETGLATTLHDGRVWFKSNGGYFSAGSVNEGLQSDPTAQLATPDEVTARLAQREADTFSGQAKIAGKQLATHAFDVATGAIRYPAMGLAALIDDKEALKTWQQLGGEQTLENAYGVYKELVGDQNAEAAVREYHLATQAQAAANPTTALASGIAGDIAPALVTGGLSAAGKVGGGLASEEIGALATRRLGEGALQRAGEQALAQGIQGVGFGMQAASEAAYLNDEPLTRQKLLAAGAMGGVLGGGIGGGLSLAGSGLGAARTRLSSIFGASDKAPRSSLAEALADSTVTKDAAQEIADRAMVAEGVPAAPGLGKKLHDLLTDIQAATTDGEREAIDKYGAGAILDPSTRAKALSGIQMFRDRPIIIDKATREIAESMTQLEKHAGDGVFESVRDLGMKKQAWEKLVDSAKRGEQVDAARSYISDMRTRLETMLPEKAEAEAGAKAAQNAVDGEAGKVADEVVGAAEAEARPSLADIERPAYGDAARIKSALGHAKKAEAALAEDVSGADAAIELDAFKRALGKLTKGSTKRLGNLRAAGDFEADAVFNTAKQFSDGYERLRQLLMNEDTWGKAGTAQTEINKGWENWLDSRRMYTGSLMRATGERASAEIPQFGSGVRYEIDPDKVGAWIDKFGTGRGKLNDEYIRSHIDATEALTKAIAKHVDSSELAPSVQAVKDAAERIKSQLKVADETVRVANQVQLAGSAHLTGAAKMALPLAGSMIGGPVGAAAGAAIGFLTSPGKVMHAAMTIQGLLGKVDAEKTGAIKSFFEKAGRSASGVGRSASAAARDEAFTEALTESGALEKQGKRAASSLATHLFGSPSGQNEQYVKRREQLAALTSSPELLAHQMERTLGSLPQVAPRLAASLSMDMSRNLQTLQQMAPPATPIGGLFGGRRQTFTPQQDIEKFAQQWEGVMNPLSILKDLNNGALDLNKVAAARAAHPDLFNDIAVEFLQHAAEMREPMNHQAAVQADLLLGLNGAGEPSVAPNFLARMEQLNQASQQAEQQRPSPRPPTNIGKGTATLSQSLQGT